ncbi:peptidase C14 [Xylaria cf. heliscus]|nr:peptidase C14 [Xylaria cf. heliscus]
MEFSSPAELVQPTHSSGVHVDIETDIDIIAIHGLDTQSPETWTWEKNSRKFNWLTDDTMLPSVAQGARIFTCNWPADLLERREFDRRTLQEASNRLLAGIQKERTSHANDRPIIFIASCLGGIILIKALIQAKGTYEHIQTSTRGIIFLATPFRGTSFKEVASLAQPVLNIWSWIMNRRVSGLINLIKDVTEGLDELRHEFTYLAVHQKYTVHTFYETKPTDLYRKLVDKYSATLDIDPHPISFERIHKMMNKFSDPDDNDYPDKDYPLVQDKIVRLLERIREEPSLRTAYKHITDTHYTKDNLRIVRVSQEELDMSQYYMNLAIVRQPGDKLRRPDGDTEKESHFSIQRRLKVETPSQELQVSLETLFESPRRLSNGSWGRPSKILIRGRAGVGKTTLCKKIVHDFTRNKMWKERFTRIFWVQLRDLKKEGVKGYYLDDIFSRLYFNLLNDDGHRRALAKTLCDVVDGTESCDSLFILDGLDEVAELLSPNHEAQGALIRLLNSPNVIITTRPHAVLPSSVKVDLELETIGFYPHQVQNYLNSAVKDDEKAERIRSFLQKYPLVESLVRIPIQLDALCFAWDGSNELSSIPETMTAIYEAIVQRLWGKDAMKLKRLKTPEDCSAYRLVKEGMNDEIRFLECMAFVGMCNNVIEFQWEHRCAIYDLFKPPLKIKELEDSLKSLSLLRGSNSPTGRSPPSYHFLHLTFQEFFAAKYFVEHWKDGKELKYPDFQSPEHSKISPDAFLGQEKYSARYDIMWRFTVGLLQGDEVARFFEAIEQEPLDLIGPIHQRLVMHCLSEANTWQSKERSALESRLAHWALLECDTIDHSPLLERPEFPDGSLHIMTEKSNSLQKERIVNSLSKSSRPLSNAGENVHMAYHAIAALEYQIDLSETTLMAMVRLLKDKVVLANKINLSDETIKELMICLQDQSDKYQQSAAELIAYESNLVEKLARANITHPESEYSSGSLGPHQIKFLYGPMLEVALREQLCLYYENGNLVCHLPSGSRIEAKMSSHELAAIISEGRQLYRNVADDEFWPSRCTNSYLLSHSTSKTKKKQGGDTR